MTRHYASKSVSHVSLMRNHERIDSRVDSRVNSHADSRANSKTVPDTPKEASTEGGSSTVNVAQRILEFLHLRDRDDNDSLHVDIAEEELRMLCAAFPVIQSRLDLSFRHKYHFVGSKIIGRGASGIVRLATFNCDGHGDRRLAVKELRKRRKQESGVDYLKKLIHEFRIAEQMRHDNVVNTMDFVMIGDRWLEVMEYCVGGDLFSAIQRGHMTQDEIDCCFRQMVEGVRYLHSVGVSHRDLKPENMLIAADGRIKITDFGVSEVFCDSESGGVSPLKEAERTVHKLRGLCGSCPYIAPEEFTGQEYDGRLVDVWSLGIIYYAMVFHGVPWEMADAKNAHFQQFLERGFDDFECFGRLPARPRALMRRILEPNPAKRITVDEICADDWFQRIRLCTGRLAETASVPAFTFSYNSDSDHDDHPHPVHHHLA